MNIKITLKAYGNKWNLSANPDNKKNMARNPKMANKFAVSTINGSVVTAKIAGIESTAKITSDNSTKTNTTANGVKYLTPFLINTNRS